MVRVTIETDELTLAKVVNDPRMIAEHNVVDAIVALVDTYDAAHNYKAYNVRQHLKEKLK